MGFLRWVMVVSGLAASDDVAGFALLHAFAGVAIGEHLGQLLTALHVALVAAMQQSEGARWTAALGWLAAGPSLSARSKGWRWPSGRMARFWGVQRWRAIWA